MLVTGYGNRDINSHCTREEKVSKIIKRPRRLGPLN